MMRWYACRWTNGRFKSTLHRVVNSNERFSTPFFLAANWDAEVSPGTSTPFTRLSVCSQMSTDSLFEHLLAMRLLRLVDMLTSDGVTSCLNTSNSVISKLCSAVPDVSAAKLHQCWGEHSCCTSYMRGLADYAAQSRV